MPKPLSRKHVEEYDSDDGFVEDAPKSKKRKAEAKPRNADAQKDEDGSVYWELTGKRRVTISDFKGNTMVGIREYYEKDGKALPGRKGITMTVEQYTAFIDLMPDIERQLKKQGITVPRPDFEKATNGEEEADDDDEEAGVEEEEEEATSEHRGKLDKFKMKKNHEATSDEDE